MSKMPGVIPVSDAAAIGKKRECPLVVIFAIEADVTRFTVTTWGKTRKLCQLAAGFGDDISKGIYNGTVEPRATPAGLPLAPTVKMYGRRPAGRAEEGEE